MTFSGSKICQKFLPPKFTLYGIMYILPFRAYQHVGYESNSLVRELPSGWSFEACLILSVLCVHTINVVEVDKILNG